MAINFPDSPSVNDIHTSGDMSWKWDGTTWKATIATSVPIPSQSGQTGEFLTTDGTNMSWEAVTPPTATAVSDQANTSTGYFDVPAGTTAQRPGSPASGNLRFNSETDAMEHYSGDAWIPFAGASPTISGISPTTAAETNTSIQITGTNFQAGTTVKFVGNTGTLYTPGTVTFVSSAEMSATTPALPVAQEPYDVRVTNPSGASTTLVDVLDVGGVPTWTTAAGTLATVYDSATGTHATLVAGDPDSTAVTYTESTSVLTGGGFALNSTTGVISGDPTDVSSQTTYNFDVDASDGVNNTNRSFSIIVNQGLDGSSAAKANDSALGILTVNPSAASGVYWLNTSWGSPAQFYCDMSADGGGWVLMAKYDCGQDTGFGFELLCQGGIVPTTVHDVTPGSSEPGYSSYHENNNSTNHNMSGLKPAKRNEMAVQMAATNWRVTSTGGWNCDIKGNTAWTGAGSYSMASHADQMTLALTHPTAFAAFGVQQSSVLSEPNPSGNQWSQSGVFASTYGGDGVGWGQAHNTHQYGKTIGTSNPFGSGLADQDVAFYCHGGHFCHCSERMQCKVSSTIAANDSDSWEIFSDASNSVQARLTWSAWWIR